MIRFSLRCERAHRFDSWFGSGGDFDRLTGAGLVACAVCGSTAVEKDLMAPAIATSAPGAAGSAAAASPPPTLSAPASPAEQALAELRRRIEAEAENVGRRFATEARRIHEGSAPERPIIGEARPAEARALVEDGIPVAPLPWSSRRTS
jgi:hypothetical protein